jgi:THO complex subunit 4
LRKCDNAITSLAFVLINCNSQPKSQPKSAATTKTTTNAAGGNASGGRAGRRGRGGRARNSRPAKKTAEELDSEMADYFDNGGAIATETGAGTNGVIQVAANGDVMEDEVLVSHKIELLYLLYHTNIM